MKETIIIFIISIILSVWIASFGWCESVIDLRDDNLTWEVSELCYEYIEWSPKEDITTYELSQCLNVIMVGVTANPFYANQEAIEEWKKLKPEAKRHFTYHGCED